MSDQQKYNVVKSYLTQPESRKTVQVSEKYKEIVRAVLAAKRAARKER